MEILQIPVLKDNYVYLLHEPASGATAAVDPAVAEPVLEALAARGWRLTHILNTHPHGDHVDGNWTLKRETGCRVLGAEQDRDRIPGLDVGLGEGDEVALGAARAQVLSVPGHTAGHLAYWFPEQAALFPGDTLFALGCGRLLGGTAEQLWQSLDRLRQLPPATRIYCAHEYTQANGRFARTVEPDNPALAARLAQVDELRRQGQPTVPSTLAEELATNPFLRPESPEIRRRLGLEAAPPEVVFAALRRRKDIF
ncbi:hydroxyacylglutathione hydrolase [Candidatus Methylocalor cossyra]|uniref:Hydroxyacylglutathione hydrolase n=1 Tax=Candidatus Methylocalor cossyra TaxID=3108543 RepID=A0ABM9NJJ0_9GAMM